MAEAWSTLLRFSKRPPRCCSHSSMRARSWGSRFARSLSRGRGRSPVGLDRGHVSDCSGLGGRAEVAGLDGSVLADAPAHRRLARLGGSGCTLDSHRRSPENLDRSERSPR